MGMVFGIALLSNLEAEISANPVFSPPSCNFNFQFLTVWLCIIIIGYVGQLDHENVGIVAGIALLYSPEARIYAIPA